MSTYSCLLIGLFTLIFSNSIIGQYQEVLSTGMVKYDIQIEPFDELIEGTIKVQGDTFIDQLNYKNVLLEAELSQESIVGFVRENILDGKMWFLNKLNDEEYLIMDMGLEVGDTFYTSYAVDCGIYGIGGNIAKVIETQQVEGRKVIKFDRGFGGGFICDSLKFIEGVGPNASLFFQNTSLDYDISGIAYNLCRMHKEDTLAFPLSSPIDLCGHSTNIIDIIPNNIYFLISPNPNNGFIKLIISNKLPITVNSFVFKVFDLTGEMVYSTIVANFLEQQIDINALSSGLYFFSISTYEEVIQLGKIIKN